MIELIADNYFGILLFELVTHTEVGSEPRRSRHYGDLPSSLPAGLSTFYLCIHVNGFVLILIVRKSD